MFDANRRGAGFSLLEVLAGASLLLLLIGLTTSILLPSLRISSQGTVQAELQQQALMGLQKMLNDLERTNASGLGILPASPDRPEGPVALSIHRLAGLTAEGRSLWESDVVVYFWTPTSRQLVRKRWPPTPPLLPLTITPDAPVRFDGDALRAITAQINRTEVTIIRDLVAFNVTTPVERGFVGQPLTLSLILERAAVAGRPPERFEIKRQASLRATL